MTKMEMDEFYECLTQKEADFVKSYKDRVFVQIDYKDLTQSARVITRAWGVSKTPAYHHHQGAAAAVLVPQEEQREFPAESLYHQGDARGCYYLQ